MGRILKRIKCPVHTPDNTPSAVIYEDGWLHCYSCGHHVRVTVSQLSEEPEAPKHVEDLDATRRYIDNLPRRNIRGGSFPCDSNGYYLQYPGSNYYKFRIFTEGANKYRSPVGHPKPLFVAKDTDTDSGIVVEGEFNALAMARIAECSVVSPGAATDFNSAQLLQWVLRRSMLVVMVDCDKAGGIAAIQLASQLKKHGIVYTIVMVKRDADEVLCDEGEEGLRQYAASVGVPRRLLERQSSLPPSGEAPRSSDNDAQEHNATSEY